MSKSKSDHGIMSQSDGFNGTVFSDSFLDLPAVLGNSEEKLDFVLPGLLAGTVGLLVSPGGTGKSMLALSLAATVAGGEDVWRLLGNDPKAGQVLFLSLEDPKVVLGQRLRALDKSRPDFVRKVAAEGNLRVAALHGQGFTVAKWEDKKLCVSDGYHVLKTELAAASSPRLLIIDTFNRALAGVPENDNSVQGLVINRIEQLIADTGAAVLLLHHTSKASSTTGQGDTQHSVRGASAISDNARFQVNLVRMTSDDAEKLKVTYDKNLIRYTVSKCNYAATPPDIWLRRGASGCFEKATPGSSAISSPKSKYQ